MRVRPVARQVIVFLALIALALTGCHANPQGSAAAMAAQGLSPRTFNSALQASCIPPLGWKPDPLKQSGNHTNQVWLSPTGNTAYGVIFFRLPLPVGHELALWGFLNEMRASEGDAILLEKHWDPQLNALRFTAEGGKYVVRTKLIVRGFNGWAVYAGSLRAFPVNQIELEIAERAREDTLVGPINDVHR
jgi:hypothetical protein